MRDSHITGALGALLALGLSTTLSAQGTFTNLGSGDANSVSDDGNVVVGSGSGTWRWTAAGGKVVIRPFEGIAGQVAVSGDGNTVVANIKNAQGEPVGGIWDSLSWMSLGYLPNALNCPSRSSVYDISGDGTTAVGLSWDGCGGRAFTWTAATGMLELPRVGTSSSRANCVSADGQVVGGWEMSPQTGARRAAVWFPGQNPVLLIPPSAANPEGAGEVWSINSDGTVIVGGDLEPFRWTAAGGFERLGRIPGVNTGPPNAYATNDDGSMVAGGFGNAFASTAFMWTEEDGMKRLDDFLAEQDVAVPGGGTLSYVFDMSPDGRAFVGRRTAGQFNWEGFHVRMPPARKFGVGITPVNDLDLRGIGSAGLGGTFTARTTNVPEQNAWTLFSQGYYPFSFAGGIIFVDTWAPSSIVFTPPTNGVSNLTFQVPAVPALVGFTLWMQSIASDATKPNGFALSNGLKLVIYQ